MSGRQPSPFSNIDYQKLFNTLGDVFGQGQQQDQQQAQPPPQALRGAGLNIGGSFRQSMGVDPLQSQYLDSIIPGRTERRVAMIQSMIRGLGRQF